MNELSGKIPDKIWNIVPGDPTKEAVLVRELHLSPLLARLLINRSIDNSEVVRDFLQPNLEHCHSPFLFKNIGRAIERVEQALEREERILIYGDSDVDGVTSTALMLRYLQRRSDHVSAYISGEEGYGLKPEVLKEAHREGVRLVISVDCGISSFDEADLMASLGIDFIILDHHEAQEILPQAVAVIDAKVPLAGYPFRDLAGVGTALKFITGCFIAHLDGFCPTYVAVDLETTGLDPDLAEIIEIGAVRYRYYREVETFHCLIKPSGPIPAEIIDLTGLSDVDVEQGWTLERAMTEFEAFLGNDPLVGHNLPFDMSFLKKAVKQTKQNALKNAQHDTLALSRQVYPQLNNHRLETVARAVGIVQEEEHRALADARCAGELNFVLSTRLWQPKIAKFMHYFLDLTALGTIADVVPLTGENRILTKIGLDQLKKSPSLGIRMLIDRKYNQKETISSRDIAWGIAPIINAAGRIGNGSLSLELMKTTSKSEARELIRQLEDINQQQKTKVQNMIMHYMSLVPDQVHLPDDRFIFLSSEGQETGITGIVANKFLDKYGRPTFIITSNGEDAIGSCRAFGNIDLVAILDECKHLLRQYGGHKHAAGYALSPSKIEQFRQQLIEIMNRLVKESDLIPLVNIDLAIESEYLTMTLFDDLDVIEPFGQDNSYPLFCLKGIIPLDMSSFGMNDLHLRLIIDSQNEPLTAIGWNKGHLISVLRQSIRPLDIAFGLQKNVWRGRTSLCLNIEHLRYSSQECVEEAVLFPNNG
ncbi:single-stranded-DNA-specific exonuclease RecJ [bacterium]|nr:single-stranded-DNA-specific exonuclease RecJ [bacterium]